MIVSLKPFHTAPPRVCGLDTVDTIRATREHSSLEVGASTLIIAFGGLLLTGYLASEQLWMFTG